MQVVLNYAWLSVVVRLTRLGEAVFVVAVDQDEAGAKSQVRSVIVFMCPLLFPDADLGFCTPS